jgi:hypothetical protein
MPLWSVHIIDLQLGVKKPPTKNRRCVGPSFAFHTLETRVIVALDIRTGSSHCGVSFCSGCVPIIGAQDVRHLARRSGSMQAKLHVGA